MFTIQTKAIFRDAALLCLHPISRIKYNQTHFIVFISGKSPILFCEYFVRHLANVAKPLSPSPLNGNMLNMFWIGLQGSAAL